MDLCDILEEALDVTVVLPAQPDFDAHRSLKREAVGVGPSLPSCKKRVVEETRHPTIWAQWLRKEFLGYLNAKVKPTTPLCVRSFCSGLGTEAFALKAGFDARMCLRV